MRVDKGGGFEVAGSGPQVCDVVDGIESGIQ